MKKKALTLFLVFVLGVVLFSGQASAFDYYSSIDYHGYRLGGEAELTHLNAYVILHPVINSFDFRSDEITVPVVRANYRRVFANDNNDNIIDLTTGARYKSDWGEQNYLFGARTDGDYTGFFMGIHNLSYLADDFFFEGIVNLVIWEEDIGYPFYDSEAYLGYKIADNFGVRIGLATNSEEDSLISVGGSIGY